MKERELEQLMPSSTTYFTIRLFLKRYRVGRILKYYDSRAIHSKAIFQEWYLLTAHRLIFFRMGGNNNFLIQQVVLSIQDVGDCSPIDLHHTNNNKY